MFNTTYKHLEDPVKLAGLSLVQWTQILACVIAAYGVSKLLPLPGTWSLSIAVTICGMPAAAAMVAMQADFDVFAYMRAVLRWSHRHTTHQPGVDPDPKTPVAYHVAALPAPPAPEPVADFNVRPDELWK